MKYTLLQQLLPLLEEYESRTGDTAESTPADFAAWLQQHKSTAAAPASLAATPNPGPTLPAGARVTPDQHETAESLITKLLTFVYRYVRGYARQALAGTPLVSFDDFTYLMTLYTAGPQTKSELMARNIHEKATGTEIIRRLQRNLFLTEEPHATDRRSKLLRITKAGQAMLFRVLGPMSQVAEMAAGNLTPAERQQLVLLLHKLDAFHYDIFAGSRPTSFEALVMTFFQNAAGGKPSNRPQLTPDTLLGSR
ncbi:MarR family winged helix-turn-helix transcriptional regulator [Hymenobacter weizhouensis]|uniref:MarR family winged helix-turn-helix transcriptional regulator n=1 Tax=Hymenobacter sp. YIM 151500-1 TaxID=2987689 RepID=UPI002227FB8D|nr:MarR family winged helix-turn-helix transcriptional regulator [Hymenobacter sp. YIM 151500-1]UYZ62184.1 MarR family winged helix-turn-helix transcriptional regulator [Hymenobacter sp. YIM 151500-1]